jgi:mono/diheme cytochrome c family protein
MNSCHRTRFAALFCVLLLALVVPCSALAADDAAAMFKARCSPCHGADGSGDTPMGKKVAAKALGSPEVQKQTDEQLQKVIGSGKGQMPKFSDRLSAAQIADLVKVVRGFAKK